MIFDVQDGTGGENDEAGAHLPRVANLGPGFDPVFLGLITGRDGAGVIGIDRRNRHRLAAEFGLGLLLNGSEVGIEINDQSPERHASKMAQFIYYSNE
jgi:hypothetical protein